MLWEIRARMKPALSIIDLIPHVHRTPALAALRRAVLEGRPATFRLSAEDRELAFHDAAVQLTSPIGARVLKTLYLGGHLKVKKPGPKPLPALDAYIATEAAFRAEVDVILAAEDARRTRLAAIVADPGLARPDELSPYLIDKVIAARLGHDASAEMQIAGVRCFRALIHPEAAESDRLRAEGRVVCWWHDAAGNRQGDQA
ncbi:hypothetical protein [Tabrizicola sp.]|uniref:hypothetical protein n=1 Tax=Tabrizicola sp. TaxID=2005166 RepID=UPI00262A949B|nr:hypothetical protein [Tabrizicola sp.]MDM7932329.1 hypothetical protein [Tabrizicola sp.]